MLLTFVGYAKNKSQNNEIYVGYILLHKYN